MKTTLQTKPAPKEKESLWSKSPVANLVRYKPSGVYFLRAKVGGKFFLESLKTDVLSIAKLRLADRLKEKRAAADKLGVLS